MSYERIPEELKTLQQWVCWKSDKIPVNPNNPEKCASSTNPDTWSNFQTALQVARDNGYGIGFVFANGYFGVDIDKCIVDGNFSDDAIDIIKTMDSYTEYSPSGTGIHIIARGTIPPTDRRNGTIEMYNSGRYFTMTGKVIDDGHDEIQTRSEEAEIVHTKYIKRPEKQERQEAPTRNQVTLDDDEIIRKASASKQGFKFNNLLRGSWQGDYKSQSEAEQGFCNMLAFWTGRDIRMMDSIFRTSGLYRKKWDEKHGKDTYGNLTLNKAIRDCHDIYDPEHGKATSTTNTQQYKIFDLTDVGNAERMLHLYGQNLRYSSTIKGWLTWNGSLWKHDDQAVIWENARATARKIIEDVPHVDNQEQKNRIIKFSTSSCNHARLKNMIEQAQKTPAIRIDQSKLDANQWLLNCKNGTVNLKTGQLQQHTREDLITKVTETDFISGAKAPLWEAFMDRIFEGNKELIGFIQRSVGYSMTGSTTEQCAFICHGCGANGKSTFLDTIQDMLGMYSKNTSMATFLAKTDANTNDIARLVGSRMATAMEADEGKKLSESLIKQLTGGDKITARFLHKEFFEFVPSFKIWMGTNHKPVIKGTDNGIWRRIMLIPFDVTIPKEKQDKDLKFKLYAEMPGILNWAVEGCLQWQSIGLNPPDIVLKATDAYRAEMDVLKSFLNECCTRKPGAYVQSSTLYKIYDKWCDENGEHPLSQMKFSLKMKEYGIEQRKSHGVKVWTGVTLSEAGKSSPVWIPKNEYGYSSVNELEDNPFIQSSL